MTDYNFWQMKGYADNRVGTATRKLLEKIDKLEKHNQELKRQLKESIATIESLRADIAARDSEKRKR